MEWDYLFAVLEKCGFGDKFVSWICLLYTSPQASVHTNDIRSDYFFLTCGTHQGCPLSLLLFALAIELLSITFRSSPLFKGVVRAGFEHGVLLYADDLLLFITDPRCVPAILSIMDKSSSFSGYKSNLQKSKCYPIDTSTLHVPHTDLPFKFTKSGFNYLAIKIARTLPGLSSANFVPLFSKTKTNFQRWSSLPLSLTGRVNAVKKKK